MIQKKIKFEEGYFEGHYKEIGDFSKKRDKELKNWFKGILNHIDRYFPLKNGKGKNLIEFGCATGVAASVLRDFGWDVTATDISNYAVRRAKKNVTGVKFMVQDMEKPFNGNRFDVAVAFDVIEHLPNPELGIKNVYNLLKKNGAVVFWTPNDYPSAHLDPTHVNVKIPSEWRKIFKRVGFKNIFIKQISVVPYFYRLHWRLNFVFPFGIRSKYFVSPVLIIARKG
jgi:2-polyprenyl-3-methyl-5-hydroxy-6-metoxy-1,4-benzoquinol methylase